MEVSAYSEAPGSAVFWQAGLDGKVLDESNFLKRMLSHDYEVSSLVDEFFGTPRRHATGEAFYRSAKPVFNVNFEPSGDSGKPWSFNFAWGVGSGPGSSWLKELLKAPPGRLVEAEDAITVSSGTPGRTLVIDRATGFLRSIRLEYPDRVGLLTVHKVSREAAKPAVHLPEKVERKTNPLEATSSRLAAGLISDLPSLAARLYREWATVGTPDRAEALREMLAVLVVRYEALRHETGHRNLVAQVVKRSLASGNTLERLEEEIPGAAPSVEKAIKTLEERERDAVRRFADEFRKALLKAAEDTPGPDGAARILTQRIQEASEAERLDRIRAGVLVPEASALLRDELAAAHAEKLAPALYVLKLRAEQARALELRVAEIGPVSFRLVLENVDSGKLKITEHEADVHLRPAERFGLVRFYAPEGDKRNLRRTLVFEEAGTTVTWVPGEPGLRVDQRLSWESSMGSMRDWACAVARLHGRTAPASTLDAFLKECRPYLRVDVHSTAAPELKSTLGVSLASRPGGGASWLDELRRAVVVEYPEKDLLRFVKGRRTVEVDLKTGLPRSVRTEFPGSAHATMKLTDVRPGAPKPEIALPEKIVTRIMPPENMAGKTFEYLEEMLQRETLAILARWDRFESDTGTLRTFYAAAASIQSECVRNRLWLTAAIEYVKSSVAKGKSLDELEDKLDDMVKFFEKAAARSDESMAARIARELAKVKTRLIEGVGPLAGPRFVWKRLEEVIDERFRPESGPEPPARDFRSLLQAAIENARAKEDKSD